MIMSVIAGMTLLFVTQSCSHVLQTLGEIQCARAVAPSLREKRGHEKILYQASHFVYIGAPGPCEA